VTPWTITNIARIGSHRAAFGGIAADLEKAARTLVVKLIKNKKTELATLRDIRAALGAETFNLITDGMAGGRRSGPRERGRGAENRNTGPRGRRVRLRVPKCWPATRGPKTSPVLLRARPTQSSLKCQRFAA
jgi:hypothetical protein